MLLLPIELFNLFIFKYSRWIVHVCIDFYSLDLNSPVYTLVLVYVFFKIILIEILDKNWIVKLALIYIDAVLVLLKVVGRILFPIIVDN